MNLLASRQAEPAKPLLRTGHSRPTTPRYGRGSLPVLSAFV